MEEGWCQWGRCDYVFSPVFPRLIRHHVLLPIVSCRQEHTDTVLLIVGPRDATFPSNAPRVMIIVPRKTARRANMTTNLRNEDKHS